MAVFEGTRWNELGQTAALKLVIVLLLSYAPRAKKHWQPGDASRGGQEDPYNDDFKAKTISKRIILPTDVDDNFY